MERWRKKENVDGGEQAEQENYFPFARHGKRGGGIGGGGVHGFPMRCAAKLKDARQITSPAVGEIPLPEHRRLAASRPFSASKFQTVARAMRKRRPVFEIRPPE